MKTQRNLSFMMPLAVAAMILAGCSEYDNGFTEKQIQFHSDFNHEFGSFDKTQDWNLAERANVTVTTSEMKDINVYTEKEGSFVQVGAFKNVSGTRKLEFDVIEDMNNLVVSDGDVALRAVVGGTVNFDDMSSVAGEVMETRGGEYVNRNMWSRDYVVPANITDAERAAVVEEFSKQHYGAYNEVLVPWTELFVQQVYKGEAEYYDAFNQQTGTASDKMNHLLIWDSSAGEGSFDGGYIHVNDFNNGDQKTVAYDDNDTEKQNPIIGLTLMRGINPDGCPTEDVTINEVTKHWVKQFEYHNAQSSEYQPTYIMKRVTWTENGVTKSGLYLGFDFYAQKRADQPADKNMDVERDWIFNDWIIKISQGINSAVPVSELQNANPAAWILAGEDLGSGFDIDYNDVVVKVERKAGENKVKVTPLAAGGTLASYLFFGTTCIGEIHQLLDASPARSGSYQPINLSGDLHEPLQSVEVNVAQDWGLTEDMSKANNMGGFTIRVLPAGTEPKAKVLNLDDPAFDKATTVKAPQQGEAPYIICVPYAYKVTNYPAVGMSEATVWEWPNENVNIATVYEDFSEWARDKTSKKDWYSKHSKEGFVDTHKFAVRSFGQQPANMTAYEIAQSGAATANAVFQEEISPNGYAVCNPPVATLELNEGVTEVSMTVGQTIDLLDYVTTNYPKCVYLSSDDYSAFTPVEAHKITCGISGHASTIHIKIATPTGVLERTLKVNSNGNNSGGQQQDQQDNQGEQNNQGGNGDVNEGGNDTPSGDGILVDETNQHEYIFTLDAKDNDTYDVKYGTKTLLSNVKTLTLNWSEANSSAAFRIFRPWGTFGTPAGASGSYTISNLNVFSPYGEAKEIHIIWNNNNDGKFKLYVSE